MEWEEKLTWDAYELRARNHKRLVCMYVSMDKWMDEESTQPRRTNKPKETKMPLLNLPYLSNYLSNLSTCTHT